MDNNIIKESELTIVTTLLDTGFVRVLTADGLSRDITLANFKTLLTGAQPIEVALNASGATTIDLSLYSTSTNFKITLIANATIVFTNMTVRTGYITVIQDGSTKYTLSYSGTAHGDTIGEPEIGELNVESFIMSAIGTADAVEPIFGTKTNI